MLRDIEGLWGRSTRIVGEEREEKMRWREDKGQIPMEKNREAHREKDRVRQQETRGHIHTEFVWGAQVLAMGIG